MFVVGGDFAVVGVGNRVKLVGGWRWIRELD